MAPSQLLTCQSSACRGAGHGPDFPSVFPRLYNGIHTQGLGVVWGGSWVRGCRAESWQPTQEVCSTGRGQAQQSPLVDKSAGSGGKKGKKPGVGAKGVLCRPPHPRPRFHFYL